MSASLDRIFDKISEYDFLNQIIPGCIVWREIVAMNFEVQPLTDGYLITFIYIYFLGLVASRIGSLFIEPILKTHYPHADYNLYIEAEAKDPKVSTLNTVNNEYRSILGAILLCFGVVLVRTIEQTISNPRDFTSNIIYATQKTVVYLALMLLFAKAYGKQTGYTVKRINKATDKSS